MESCSNQKSVKQIKIDFIFEILQSSHRLPWWQLCILLAFSQPASWWMLFQQSRRSSHICWAPTYLVQLIPNHLNWVEVEWLWRPGHLSACWFLRLHMKKLLDIFHIDWPCLKVMLFLGLLLNKAIFCIPLLPCHNTTDWLKHKKEINSTN